MNKVQDISTPLATVVGRDFMHDSNPIGADQIYVKKEEDRKSKGNNAGVTTGKNKTNLYTVTI